MRLITQEYGMWADRVYAGGDVYQSYSSNQFSTSFTLTVVTCDFIAILKCSTGVWACSPGNIQLLTLLVVGSETTYLILN